MNFKTLLLIIFFSQLFTVDVFAFQTEELEDFTITISGDYFKSGNFWGIQLNNQNGEYLYHEISKKTYDGNPIIIGFKKNKKDKVLITILNSPSNPTVNLTTYVDIENGSFIEPKSGFAPYPNGSKKVEIEIENVNDFEKLIAPTTRKKPITKYSKEENTLFSKFRIHSDHGVFCLIKQKNEKTFRYFFDENYSDDKKEFNISFQEDYSYLEECKKPIQLNFPSKGRWRGSIRVWLKNYDKPIYLFSNKIGVAKKIDFWELNLPKETIEYSHFNFKGGGLIVNKIYSGLPEKIDEPNINIQVVTEKDLEKALMFNTSKNVGFYEAEYKYNVGLYYSEIINHNVTEISKWKFIGVDNFVKIVLPQFHPDIIGEVEGLGTIKDPFNLTITGYQVEFENPKESWIVPSTLLNGDWRMKNGVIGKWKSIKIKNFRD